MSVHFDEPGAIARYELAAQQHRHKVNEQLSPLGALDWQPGKISLSRSTVQSKPETWEERNAWMANAINTTCELFTELFPPVPPINLKLNGDQVVNSDSGEKYDLVAVAAKLPWQPYKRMA